MAADSPGQHGRADHGLSLCAALPGRLRIPLVPRPAQGGIAFSPDSRYVAAADYGAEGVLVFDLDTGNVTPVQVPASVWRWAPDGRLCHQRTGRDDGVVESLPNVGPERPALWLSGLGFEPGRRGDPARRTGAGARGDPPNANDEPLCR